MQVAEAIHRYGNELGARVLPIYGGQPIGRQLRALERGVDVVVATPGARSTTSPGHARLGGIEDRRAGRGRRDARHGLRRGHRGDPRPSTPEDRQTALFSATMPPRIDGMVRRHLRDPVRIRARPRGVGRRPTARWCGRAPTSCRAAHKPAALGRVLDVEAPAAAIVFCRTRDEVDQLTETLNGRGYRAEALHGGMDQEQRDRVMGRLRSGAIDLLVATDVAARGLDIDQLTHVVNYDVPSAPESYVHRIGRVGRAGREGVAITLAEPREHRMLKTIERVTEQRITVEKLPTVADLRARRLELTRAALRESLLDDDDLEPSGPWWSRSPTEFDPMEVALAAVKLAHEASAAPRDDEEIPRRRNAAAGRPTRRPQGDHVTAAGRRP